MSCPVTSDPRGVHALEGGVASNLKGGVGVKRGSGDGVIGDVARGGGGEGRRSKGGASLSTFPSGAQFNIQGPSPSKRPFEAPPDAQTRRTAQNFALFFCPLPP